MKLPRYCILFALLSSASLSAFAAEPITVPLWPEGAPGKMLPHSEATEAFLKKHSSKNTVTDISAPTLVIHKPEKPNGTSVIVAPGGGYTFLSAVHEGTQVCEWLNSLGVTGILLNYRTPTRDEAAPHEKPVQDAQRAIGIVRHHAKEWGLDPNRVGLLGFSAGGNLLAHVVCDRTPVTYPVRPETEDVAAPVPNFAIMIYGGGFLDKDLTKFAPGFSVPKDAPPIFLACATNDGTNPLAMTKLYLEYKRLEIPAEIHMFAQGGHGFGMRKDGKPINEWPQRCGEWMASMQWLPKVALIDQQIEAKEKALADMSRSVSKLICGNDVIDLKQRMLDAQQHKKAALAKGDKEQIALAEEEIEVAKSQQDELKKYTQGALFTSDTLLADMNAIKQRLYKLQEERSQLLSGTR